MTAKSGLKLLLHCQVEKETVLEGRIKTSMEKIWKDMYAEFIRDHFTCVYLVSKGRFLN